MGLRDLGVVHVAQPGGRRLTGLLANRVRWLFGYKAVCGKEFGV